MRNTDETFDRLVAVHGEETARKLLELGHLEQAAELRNENRKLKQQIWLMNCLEERGNLNNCYED